MKQYGNWELYEKSTPEKFFAFSDAYLDSAKRLCKVLIRSTKKANYERGAVVLYLSYHSVELFLKGLILLKYPNEKLHHNVEEYYKRYKNLYPGKKFNFDLPFKTNYTGLEPEEIKRVKKTIPSQEQTNRYPIDKNGNEWNGAFGFEPNSFLKIITRLENDFSKIRSRIPDK